MDTAVDDCEKGFSEKTPLLGASESGSISNYSHSQSHAYGSHASGAGRRGPGTVSRSTTPIDSTPHTLSIIDVSYTVKDTVGKWWQGALLKPRVTKEVLKRVNLHLKSGETVAILGNSGSGKTSLLDVVSYRTAKNGTVTGAIFLDSVCWNANLVKTEASYVMQADRLLVNLSVRETLYYIARLKFAGDKRRFRSIRERFSFKTNIEPNLMYWNKNQVDDVITDVGLRHVADSRIGGYVSRGISGGEKRRVSIAVQLLQDPKILLLDEPTSGLDSFTAHYLVSALADLARNKNKIVLMTVHQPRSDIFRLFDRVGILCLGELVYYGPAGDMVPYFSSIGYPCPVYSNPLDHYVDIASIDRRDSEAEAASFQRVNSLTNAYVNSAVYQRILQEIGQAMDSDASDSLMQTWSQCQNSIGGSAICSWFAKFWILLRRMSVNLARDRSTVYLRVTNLITFAALMWLFVGHLKNTQTSIQDRIGVMYETVAVGPYTGLLNAVAEFPNLRDQYFRETRDGLYSTGAFLTVYVLHIMPFVIFQSIAFGSLVYWCLGLQDNIYSYFMYMGVVAFMSLGGEIIAVIVMAIVQSPHIATSTTGLILTVCALVASGFLRSLQNMLGFFKAVGWGMMHKYASEILIANEFNNLTLTCGPSEVPCLTNGSIYIMLYYPNAVEHRERNFAVLGGFMLGFILLAFFFFKIRGVKNLQ